MREIAAEIKARLDKASSLNDVGLTPRRMTDIFKQEYGVTPKEYADSLAFNGVCRWTGQMLMRYVARGGRGAWIAARALSAW